jgi:hypothetical protein
VRATNENGRGMLPAKHTCPHSRLSLAASCEHAGASEGMAPAKSNVGAYPIVAAAHAVVPYSRSVFTPGIGTGYLPSALGMTGAGPLAVNSATPGAIS